MNRFQRAFQELKGFTDYFLGNRLVQLAMDVFRELVDRATPKAVEFGTSGCPSCDYYIEGIAYEIKYFESFQYCPNCGQALDWGSEEKK